MVASFIRRASQFGASVFGALPVRKAPAELPFPDTVIDLPVHRMGVVSYSWLLDAKRQIVGYRFGWARRAAEPEAADGFQLQTLIDTAAHALLDRPAGWPLGDAVLMFDVTGAAIAPVQWRGLPPARIILGWQGADFVDPQWRELLLDLRQQGFGLMLSGDVPLDAELREIVTHCDVGPADESSMAHCRRLSRRPVHPIATSLRDWADIERCAAQRVPTVVSPAVEPPRGSTPPGKLQPGAVLIVRLLQMTQSNVDIREIESTLKRDAALTWRFLRHINSPAVGTGVEIESLKHAVAMLGYTRLFRWLLTLLATTDARSSPPFLMKKAIVRGRLMELLGRPLLGAPHGDNLFLVGMFSVMDQLLGVPMEDLLQRVQLADGVTLAILTRAGMYGPFLELAIACEAGSAQGEQLVEALFMTPAQVNAAQLAAIAWSHELVRADVD